MYITFKTAVEAQMAIHKSGKVIDNMMIGVMMYERKMVSE